MPSCCCWTKPGRLAERIKPAVGALIRRLAESHAVLLIEHDSWRCRTDHRAIRGA
jgi:hypothetical protein